MSKALIIAEKPSVAGDIARALGGCTKEKDFFESDQYLITSAVGHLLEIGAPEGLEVKRGKWNLANLPVIPQEFALKPIEKTEARLKLIQKFVKRADIGEVINACDAGREGELIFTYIMHFTGCRKPVRRLWLQSMTTNAIRDGFKALRQESSMRGLRDAAMCRSEADWLIGINGTRAMTAFNSKGGGFFLTTVGRVQTPTLSLVVEREKAIRQFVAKPYWRIRGDFMLPSGEYAGYWFDEKFNDKTKTEHERADRIWDAPRMESLMRDLQTMRSKPIHVEDQSKKQTQLSPLLYDLTSLQREANGRFGFSARTTLSIAQALYEKHKAITYPRTDSRALPEDYLGTIKDTLNAMEAPFAQLAKKVLKENWVHPNKRIFNNAKISDHFAIIPTASAPSKLSEVEEKLYGLIVRRFLAVFYPPAEYWLTTRISRVGDHAFKSDGRVLEVPGWLEVYGKEGDGEDANNNLPKCDAGALAQVKEITSEAEETRPPARFNEATLLSAMESAGKLIEDDELKDAMKDKGLGTPATRASIIEGLITEEYIIREGRNLQATAKSMNLMILLKGLEVEELMSAELTAEWEQHLSQIEQGHYSREAFMKGISNMAKHIVEQAKRHENDTLSGDYVTLSHPCPACGGSIHENYRRYQCAKCEFSVNKVIAGRIMAAEEVEGLLRDKMTPELKGFRSKMGRPFNAQLKLEGSTASFHFEGSAPGAVLEWISGEILGNCPKCGHSVMESTLAYACERNSGAEKTCDFRIGKTILQRDIEIAQVQKILTTGKTDLLEKFISKKGRPFKAFLVMKEGGTIGFEFDNSEPSGRFAKARAATAEKKASKLEKAEKATTEKKPRKTSAATTVKKSAAPKKKPALKSTAKKTVKVKI